MAEKISNSSALRFLARIPRARSTWHLPHENKLSACFLLGTFTRLNCYRNRVKLGQNQFRYIDTIGLIRYNIVIVQRTSKPLQHAAV